MIDKEKLENHLADGIAYSMAVYYDLVNNPTQEVEPVSLKVSIDVSKDGTVEVGIIE